MKSLPPLNDAILIGVAQLVDDAQTGRRDPSHEQIAFCIEKAGLKNFDPASQGQNFGKAKRVRAVLSQGLCEDFVGAQKFIDLLVSQIRGLGGFRATSPNFVGTDAIANLQAAFSAEGFVLTNDGAFLQRYWIHWPARNYAEALMCYVRRAQRGSDDAALLTGTGKDLLEEQQPTFCRSCGAVTALEPISRRCLGKLS